MATLCLTRRLPAVHMIPLGGRRGPFSGYAVVDLEDAAVVAGRAWHRDVLGYVAHSVDQEQKVRLHRVLMVPPIGKEVDHINGDRLDNRRANLRVVTAAENLQNVRTAKGAFRGVYLDARSGIYYGQVKHKGHRYTTSVRSRDARVVQRAVLELRLRILTHSDPESRKIAA